MGGRLWFEYIDGKKYKSGIVKTVTKQRLIEKNFKKPMTKLKDEMI